MFPGTLVCSRMLAAITLRFPTNDFSLSTLNSSTGVRLENCQLVESRQFF